MKIYFDVGCAVGTYAHAWSPDQNIMVYAFEPDPVFYSGLKQFEAQQPRFRVFPYAITDTDGEADFYISDNPVCNSLNRFAENYIWHQTINTIRITTRRLDTFCKEMNISHIHYLKSDAQGSDLDVLKSLGDMISHVDQILVEAFLLPQNVYVKEAKKEDIMSFLTPKGFTLSDQRNDGDYADLFFIRS